jgi:hypothetical protein
MVRVVLVDSALATAWAMSLSILFSVANGMQLRVRLPHRSFAYFETPRSALVLLLSLSLTPPHRNNQCTLTTKVQRSQRGALYQRHGAIRDVVP